MRELYAYELTSVSGGCDSPSGPCEPTPTCPPKGNKGKRRKGNNGFGNGGDDGSPNGKQDVTR